ncbi:vitronectin b isoform X2 [Cynoglossus semilaevis]|uniref:Vitronectin n=1 Tax=Cynoglossus semilaevis TaxID=244447 RepID=A0A3P8WVN4_CYNSE|nr:vitronectin-like isoform X2 [Cynoglossus semilaevis]
MKAAAPLLALLLLLDATLAAEQSCRGQCGSFDPQRTCQCDSLCYFYSSCCPDYDTACPKKTRGDTFATEDDLIITTTPPTTTAAPAAAEALSSLTANITDAPVDPDAAPCSGRPFDAFLQLKNGSIYAFRGRYFFELDDKAVLPGYPKLIQDVWGMDGPIDAAFTRINCQGKSYIFKGKKYWRFDGDVLDEDFPRDISTGFDTIANDVDAAFAVPAPSYRGQEKAYFFKGDRYYEYEFKQQPSHEECVQMSRSSPSVLFTQYTDLFCDQTWGDMLAEFFGGIFSDHQTGPRLISRDWRGFRPPVDAALVGRVSISSSPTPTSPPIPKKRSGWRNKKVNKRRGGRRRQSRHVLFDDFWGLYDDWMDYDYGDIFAESAPQEEQKGTPVQNIYFFKGDKYYRMNLQTKRVDSASPPYPRSIAKFWLGCTDEETTTAESRAENKK